MYRKDFVPWFISCSLQLSFIFSVLPLQLKWRKLFRGLIVLIQHSLNTSTINLSSLTIQSWQCVVLLLLLLLLKLGHLGNVVLTVVQWEVQVREGRWGGQRGGKSCCCYSPTMAGGGGRSVGEIQGHQVLEELPSSVPWVSSWSGARGGGEQREGWLVVQRVEGALLLILVAVLLLQWHKYNRCVVLKNSRGQCDSTTHWNRLPSQLNIQYISFKLQLFGVDQSDLATQLLQTNIKINFCLNQTSRDWKATFNITFLTSYFVTTTVNQCLCTSPTWR